MILPTALIKPQASLFLATCLLTLAPSFSHGGRGHTHPSPSCKAIPGDADWPSQRSWARFNESLGGGLLQPAPPGAVCHQRQRAGDDNDNDDHDHDHDHDGQQQQQYDPDQCTDVAERWRTYEFHSGHPTSSMWNQFSNDSCLPDPSYPCDASGYPAFVVNATETEHVQRSVDFARKNNVRLIVKATGHDYIGRSIAPNSLSIWTHHMKGIRYHEGSFKPRGCRRAIQGNAVTARAGAQMMEVYEFLDAYNETIVGGGGKTVGVAGYVTGAGHSMLSARYGLAADQVLEMEVVTPDGDVVTANECQNKDLFWAMRGGGGSTFGVLTSLTMKTYPTPKMLHLTLLLFAGPEADVSRISDAHALFLSKVPTMADAGMSGYLFPMVDFPNLFLPEPPRVTGVFGIAAIFDTHDEADFTAIVGPVIAEVQAAYPEANLTWVPVFEKYDSQLDWFRVHHDKSSAGLNQLGGSWLLDEESLTGDVGALSHALGGINGLTGYAMVHMVSGKGVHNAKPRGGSNGVNPAWRKAYIHLVTGQEFEPLNPAAKSKVIDTVNDAVEYLRELAPDSGAYMNEASPYEPDWQRVYWGDNYERLSKIKKLVDPKSVFWCHPCVGNEGWEEVDGRLCKVG